MDAIESNTPVLVRSDIDSLILALPSLRRKQAPSIRKPGDSAAFERWAKGACFSTGERCAAALVLHVWNRHTKWRAPWRFDFALTMGVFDGEHLAVFAAWVRDPWYC